MAGALLEPSEVARLSIDFETRSTVDLNKAGVYRYAEDPTTDIWLMAWAFDDEEPELWYPTTKITKPWRRPGNGPAVWDNIEVEVPNALPERIVDHIESGGEIRAWNAQFERVMWREIMVKRYGAPYVDLEQWHDTAAEAAAMSLPRSLGEAARVLGVTQQKSDTGRALMLRMARPRRIEKDGTIVWWDEPKKVAELGEYCKQDVRTERAIIPAIRRLTPHEREIYLLDQTINDRGIAFDRALVLGAREIVDIGVEAANHELLRVTDGAASEVTKVGQIKSWLATKGVEVTSLNKATVKEMLDSGGLPFDVNRAIELRAEAGRSSVAKLESMLTVANEDDRLRGLLFYHAAGTGRWAGKLVQPQNFPRGEIADIESYIPWVRDVAYRELDLLAPPIVVVSSMLRSMLTAAPGRELIAGDFSAIEARVVNWVAGQEDMLELFRQYDAAPKADKPKYDPYRRNAARLYNIPLDQVEKFPHRQTGKFQELGCGFQMGAKKAVSAAKEVYGLIITEEQAVEIVGNYRATHDRVQHLWYEANDAAIEAVLNPGRVVTFGARGMLRFVMAGPYLYLVLPSGRALAYAAASVKDAPTPWGELRPQVHFWGINGYTRQWSEQRLYGGLIVENAVQAIARDLMADAMLRLEHAGYEIVLTVHDEIVSEVDRDFGSVEEFERIATEVPAWAEGCPIAAEGWRGFRYRK